MAVRVLKFGGTSVETPAHILSVARRILAVRQSGDAVVVVVSAMGQTTDELIRLARRVARTPSRRELDMLLSAGERISMTLLAMCLESLGCPAISFTGSQSGIVTDSRHSDARIRAIRCFRIEEELRRGRVVIVAGFQGVSAEKEVTTLGRGGSDTTAVGLAIRLNASACEIYTDVPGVLTADPRIVPGALVRAAIGYDPMIALSHLGGRVLFRRAVLLARKFAMPLEVKSAQGPEGGTRIPVDLTRDPRPGPRVRPGTEDEFMETDRVLGVALESPVHWVRVLQPAAVPTTESPGTGAPGAGAPPEAGSPSLLAYASTVLPDGSRLVQFVAAEGSDSGGEEVEPWIDPNRWGARAEVSVEAHAALVSLVGEAILADPDVLRRAEGCLRARQIPVWAVHTASLSVSFVVPEAHGERAARALHEGLVEGR